MRLLNTTSLKLSQFWEENIPPYAILSHTWEEDEMTLQEFENADVTSHDRKGYQKIKRCAEVARNDDFDWIWIDTCCIDKTSSSELSEAINSMFKWYQRSSICYAYLSDFTATAIEDHYYQFAKCRWFKRGWTLQELIAPQKVVFLNAGWDIIGSKDERIQFLSSLTRIDPDALRGTILKRFSLAQRMSWAASRQTTRREDIAYCLLGIFDINMPLLYGEGTRAFIRLQETIMARSSSDYSLLAWSRYLGRLQNPSRNLLAESPIYFKHSGNLVRRNGIPPRPVSCVVVEEGVHIQLRVRKSTRINPRIEALLNCADAQYPGQELLLTLVLGDEQNTYQVQDIVLIKQVEAGWGEDHAMTIQQSDISEERVLEDMPKLSIAISLNHSVVLAVFGAQNGKALGNEMILSVDDLWSKSTHSIQILLRGRGAGLHVVHIYPSQNPMEKGVPRFTIQEVGSAHCRPPRLPLPLDLMPDGISSEFTEAQLLDIPEALPSEPLEAKAFGPAATHYKTASTTHHPGPRSPSEMLHVESRGVLVDGERKALITIKDFQPGHKNEIYHLLNPLPRWESAMYKISGNSSGLLPKLWKRFVSS